MEVSRGALAFSRTRDAKSTFDDNPSVNWNLGSVKRACAQCELSPTFAI